MHPAATGRQGPQAAGSSPTRNDATPVVGRRSAIAVRSSRQDYSSATPDRSDILTICYGFTVNQPPDLRRNCRCRFPLELFRLLLPFAIEPGCVPGVAFFRSSAARNLARGSVSDAGASE